DARVRTSLRPARLRPAPRPWPRRTCVAARAACDGGARRTTPAPAARPGSLRPGATIPAPVATTAEAAARGCRAAPDPDRRAARRSPVVPGRGHAHLHAACRQLLQCRLHRVGERLVPALSLPRGREVEFDPASIGEERQQRARRIALE